MFETFEHTADIGLRASAPDLNKLFAEAGRGFTSLLVADLNSVRTRESVVIEIAGQQLEYLLFDWLNELLHLFECRRLLFSDFEIQVGGHGLNAIALGEPVAVARHALEHEVKAVTYHGLKLEHSPYGYLAEVILDI
ncbi:MAG: archease [Pirellulales bacterium]|nr:archease [Pirellulales bacterium]